jgi:glycosyltransferase involved in cell wall biosynthesis
VDATIAASLYIAAHPYVIDTRVPSYIIPGSVNTTLFNVSRVLQAGSQPPVPLEYCGGAFRAHACAGPTAHSPWCKTLVFVFGYLARLSPEKGVGLFMSAAASVMLRMPHARFIMIGRTAQDEYMQGLLELRQLYGLQDVVSVQQA